jgi:hypothetical protein
MGFRSTAILAALLLALLGYLYFFEETKVERALTASEAKRVLLVDEAGLTRIVVQRHDTTMVFTRPRTKWRIEEPISADADGGEVGALIRSMKYMDGQGQVADESELRNGTTDIAEFGLDSPEISIFLVYRNGTTDTLHWGDRSPTGRYTYLRPSGGQGIVKVESRIRGSIEKGLISYRNKKAIPFEKDRVERLEVLDHGKRFLAIKAGNFWSIQEPVEERADGAVLDRLVNRLHTARLNRFIDEADAFELGLNPPGMVISILDNEVGSQKELRIGNRTAGDQRPSFFANFGNANFSVDSILVRDVRKLVADARVKSVFNFEPAGVDSIILVYGDSLVVCVKDSAGSHWFAHEPRLHIAPRGAVGRLVRNVMDLKAKRFVSETRVDPARFGLEEPVFRAEFFRKGQILQRVVIGEKHRIIYAVALHRPQVVEIELSDLLRMKLELISVIPEVVEPDTIKLGEMPKTGI